ncbi:MAG: YaeQ family protein [Rhodocyclaceae bacterium]|nr:YaeQ family protein [Rhodocyclaceae bacterium]
MALKATIYKAELQISDLDRHYYQEHSLTLARHPSETDERVMVRLLAFSLYASETLAFGRGISSEDEATLWDIDATGNVDLWIDVGLPDERDIRRACHRARKMVLLTYGGRAADVWWQQNGAKLAAYGNLTVLNLSAADSQALATLAGRNMKLQCTIQEGNVWLGDADRSLELTPQRLMG